MEFVKRPLTQVKCNLYSVKEHWTFSTTETYDHEINRRSDTKNIVLFRLVLRNKTP
jgi:hypothetical protein